MPGTKIAAAFDEAPKARMALAVLAASMLWLVALLSSPSINDSPHTTARPIPIPERALDMRMVEVDPVPEHVATNATASKATPSKPTPIQVHGHGPKPNPVTRPMQNTAQPSDPQTAKQPPQSQPAAAQSDSPTPNAPARPDSPVDSSPPAPSDSTGTSAAHALSQPLPDLPDDLREDNYQTVATARFTIHPDGSTDVELIRPTANPRLNQILVQTLKRWRFSPAMQNGHTTESRQDVRVHFNVD
ncbi:energy transducer TonB [Paraburkholderia sp. BCC1886]|uniref:energy transducer TonB n=1 Tax=Paraburkholderia sp. BCC1886 TaxID=2562670 RepID=UPI0021B30C3F|nr:energy transducer TonB [Paraburkholderia sp. BCC1886]